MVSTNITKIFFRGNEIVALYWGDTLIFKKSEDIPSGKYTVRGTVNPYSGEQSIQLYVNGKQEQFNVNTDNTFEHTFVNVPITNMSHFTQPCRDKLKTIDLSSLNTSKVTSMDEAFIGCHNLEEIILTNLDTSSVTNMSYMFSGCFNLTSLDVSNFDTSKVTNMTSMFSSCSVLKSLDVSNFDTSNVTDIKSMFSGCFDLTSLDVSNFDTSKVTNMTSMFSNCSVLKSLDVSNFDTSNVTDMSYMFIGCFNLTSLDVSNFNTSNVTDISSMFTSNSALEDLYMNFNVRSVISYSNIFYNCKSLKNVVGKFEGTNFDLDLFDCPLTASSAMVFINGLATVTEKRTLALSRTTYDSLTNEQIAIATSKGWTVTRN